MTQKISKLFRLPTLALLGSLIALPALALEVLTAEDFVKGTIVENHLIKVADNAIILFDTSSSMNEEYKDTGKSKLEVAVAEFKRRNQYFPDLGHTFGVYEYTSWNEVYPAQAYNRDQIAAALEELPEDGSGPTYLATGIVEATKVIEKLEGRTVLFLFYDGNYSGDSPDPALWKLVKENDVCLLMISSADEGENSELSENLSRVNACSRLIPFDYFIERPEYTTHSLFDVIATVEVITFTEQRIVGVEVNDIGFDSERAGLTDADKAELDKLGGFMSDKPSTFVVLAGYTDNHGVEDYNEHLSQVRTEMVADYLTEQHGIDDSRLVLHWHGSDNPIASNDTAEGRAKNRRVEIAVGGL
ncbi:MAG: OmpA family protein [Woeseiaceae bacterium]